LASRIFAKRGEAYFRILEHRITFELMRDFSPSSPAAAVISLPMRCTSRPPQTLIWYSGHAFEVCLSAKKTIKAAHLPQPANVRSCGSFSIPRGVYRARSDFSVDGSREMPSDIVREIIVIKIGIPVAFKEGRIIKPFNPF
jgi:hypothetical protein